MDEDDYSEFLDDLCTAITRRNGAGEIVWREDKEVIRTWCQRQRNLGKKLKVEQTMPVLLTMWHGYFQNEKRKAREAKQFPLRPHGRQH